MTTVFLFGVPATTAEWLARGCSALRGVTLETAEDESALVEKLGAQRAVRGAEIKGAALSGTTRPRRHNRATALSMSVFV